MKFKASTFGSCLVGRHLHRAEQKRDPRMLAWLEAGRKEGRKQMMNQEEVNQSGSSSSPDSNPCPICLGLMVRESYLDSCFHKFCYNCIVRWAQVIGGKHSCPSSVKCPLCKADNFSIIHGFDGCSFQQHYFNQDIGDSFILSKAHKYRLQCYYTEAGNVNDIFDVQRYWKSYRSIQLNPRLQDWLKRELQALTQEEDVDVILHHILGVIESFWKRKDQKHVTRTPETEQGEFKGAVLDAAKPFLLARADRFVNELELFLASRLNMEAYDAVYIQRLGWNNPREINLAAPEESNEQTNAVLPYLHIFDEDSDETD